MNNFSTKYARLNAAQKKAVDTVEGPVVVIAGPGTGKTELLSMRVANIFNKTDTLPENVLCLTFTDSGAATMRQRLDELIGKAASYVSVHTFHSLGSELISSHPDYFYNGAEFRAADELTIHNILHDIFSELPHNNPLAKKMNDEFTYLNKVRNTLSDFKRSGLTPDEIQKIITHNQNFIDYMEPSITSFFDRAIHSSMFDELPELQKKITSYDEVELRIPAAQSLQAIFKSSFEQLLEEIDTSGKTTPLTAWRNKWFEKNSHNHFVFKDRKRIEKLLAASIIYLQYMSAMQEKGVYDYDDMILKAVHALELFSDLKLNLQEKYQYILVDEFQDTNGAQLRLLLNLLDNPVHNGRPNILVVGDDDQAIYSFQGAESSNIAVLQSYFKDPLLVTLKDNYRSHDEILKTARSVIVQGKERLELTISELDKTLTAHAQALKPNSVKLLQAQTQEMEFSFIAQDIQKKIKKGASPSDITILARNHKDIAAIMPYLSHQSVPTSYEYQDNILDHPSIEQLLLFARIVDAVRASDFPKINQLLPELLSHPMWNISAQTLWQISIQAYKNNTHWLEEMLQNNSPELPLLATHLLLLGKISAHERLETMLDYLVGTQEFVGESTTFISPLKNFFFSPTTLLEKPEEFIRHLDGLKYLISTMHDYFSHTHTRLSDFITFIDESERAHIRYTLPKDAYSTHDAVQLMTAHKAKGMEFNSVYIINAIDTRWGSKSRNYSTRLGYPENLSIAPAGETEDEKLRLFYVAMTRAKQELVMSYASQDQKNSTQLHAHFLHSDAINKTILPKNTSVYTPDTLQETAWYHHYTKNNDSLKHTLEPLLSHYQLSATHLNAFIDVVNGGPQSFLLYHLLRFPAASNPHLALGSAIHATLKKAHEHLNTTKQTRPIEDCLYDFESFLASQTLSPQDTAHFTKKGADALQHYLSHKYATFKIGDLSECNFTTQHVMIDSARVTGVIDVMSVNKTDKTISILDYKTGKPSASWKGRSDTEKIKLHKYKQQLLFYKLLIENSREYHNYTVTKGCIEFIEPDEIGKLHSLELTFEDGEVEQFKKLIQQVWQHIISLDLPDITSYDASYKGVLAFENDLLKK